MMSITTRTGKNLEAAFAGESMAFMKYTYFAKIARKQGDEMTARVFEETAAQEIHHALGHLDILYPEQELSSKVMLKMAIEGETYEYSEMYPGFHRQAVLDQQAGAVQEFAGQIEESAEHAEQFRQALAKAEKRFAALAKVERRHAEHYQNVYDRLENNII